MNGEEFLEALAAKLKIRKDLDVEVTEQVIELLLNDPDPLERVESLELSLYKLAMRRAGGK